MKWKIKRGFLIRGNDKIWFLFLIEFIGFFVNNRFYISNSRRKENIEEVIEVYLVRGDSDLKLNGRCGK